MERSDQMGRGGAPLGRLWTWKTWAVLAVLASSHGACCFTIQVWSGGVGARWVPEHPMEIVHLPIAFLQTCGRGARRGTVGA